MRFRLPTARAGPPPASIERERILELAKGLQPAEAAPLTQEDPPGSLLTAELFWRNCYSWLKDSGYLLRSRYQPDWIPSWTGTGRNWEDCEDGQPLPRIGCTCRGCDTYIRRPDCRAQKVLKSTHPLEADIGRYFSSEPLASEPHNRCVPILDVLQSPSDTDLILIVMPILRKYDSPPFDTFGEVVDFFGQIFRGLRLMHAHNVAHRDCNRNNTMMDPSTLFPDSYHPANPDKTRDFRGKAKHYTRGQRPPKYYLVDFGLSRRYEERPVLEDIIVGGDKSAPEHRNPSVRCDPFPTDVYYIGNLIREDFLTKKQGFQFIEPLVAKMVQDDPAERPQMTEVVEEFDTICASLGKRKMRSRVVSRSESVFSGFFRHLAYWKRRVSHAIWKITPPSTPSVQSQDPVNPLQQSEEAHSDLHNSKSTSPQPPPTTSDVTHEPVQQSSDSVTYVQPSLSNPRTYSVASSSGSSSLSGSASRQSSLPHSFTSSSTSISGPFALAAAPPKGHSIHLPPHFVVQNLSPITSEPDLL